ncbi:MAG: MmcQ/YjbR family DNA-binding protein [Ignavibacteriaceae bacterium]
MTFDHARGEQAYKKMNLEIIREYCLKKKGVEEESPFGVDNPVYKVMGKIFLIASLNPPITINVKCNPSKAIDLRERYEEVQPGYHMNKKHWNTIDLEGTLKDNLILEMINHSYDLVVEGLSKKEKEKLKDN